MTPGFSVADGADRRGEVRGAAVGELVAVDRGDDGVPHAELPDGLGDVPRLLRVERPARSLCDRAEAAAPGADVAHEHERRRPLASPALEDVGALRLLADGVEVLAPDEVEDAAGVVVVDEADLQPVRAGGLPVDRPVGVRDEAGKGRVAHAGGV